MKYANVIIENKSRHTDNFFTYLADDSVQVGDKVMVPFGLKDREKEGYVFDGWQGLPHTMPANDVIAIGMYSASSGIIDIESIKKASFEEILDFVKSNPNILPKPIAISLYPEKSKYI